MESVRWNQSNGISPMEGTLSTTEKNEAAEMPNSLSLRFASPNSPCPMPNSLCPMPHAPCPMPYARTGFIGN